MFTLGTRPPKKCVRDPLALFSVSRSSSFTGTSFVSNHSARPAMTLVFPTPPFPPIERIILFAAPADRAAASAPDLFELFIRPTPDRNPKPEFRNPKQIQNPNFQIT